MTAVIVPLAGHQVTVSQRHTVFLWRMTWKLKVNYECVVLEHSIYVYVLAMITVL